MFLVKEKRKKGIYLSIAKSYRDPVTKKPKQKKVKNIGYLEDLKKTYDDPVAHFKNVAKEMTDEFNINNGKTTVTLNLSKTMTPCCNIRKNFGYIALSQVYNKLNLNDFFINRQASLGLNYNLNNIVKLLLYNNILFADSEAHAFARKNRFFEKMDFKFDNILDSFKYITRYNPQLRQWIHNQICEIYGRKHEPVFYYTTNHYFEVDQKKWKELSEDFNAPRLDPILQLGIFVDSNRLPITYVLFRRNPKDLPLFNVALKKNQSEYFIGRSIMVADNIANDYVYLYHILQTGNGYIVSQSIRNSDKNERTYALDQEGYKPIDEGEWYKSRIITRKIEVTDSDGHKKNKFIKEKQVIFYNSTYARWATAERENILMRGKDLIAHPSKYNRRHPKTDVHYSRSVELEQNISNGSLKKHPLSIDSKKLKEEELYDGYYVLYTSELNMDDISIINAYKDLWEVEIAFQMNDKYFEGRPDEVSWSDHLSSKCAILYLSLVVTRILELDCENSFTSQNIVSSLKKSNCILIEDNLYLIDYYDKVLELIGTNFGLNFAKKYRTLQNIKSLISASKKD